MIIFGNKRGSCLILHFTRRCLSASQKIAKEKEKSSCHIFVVFLPIFLGGNPLDLGTPEKKVLIMRKPCEYARVIGKTYFCVACIEGIVSGDKRIKVLV